MTLNCSSVTCMPEARGGTVLTCMPAHHVVTLPLPLGRSVPRPPTLVVPHKIVEASRRPPHPLWSVPFRGLVLDVLLCMGSPRVGSDSGPLERPSCAEDITRSSWWFIAAGGCILMSVGVV
ncbi:hypothetical protein T4D_7807 [Trichinella pseudospiralis]|uniref:Uncharacterized protein n=1 Tax=Trichinella pseudospiralis TaxID=6337 RepID=A0A0V1FZL0_TRIPS|nr:hypothetical protein T4D_7807 [Trichinella pseudospiralis]